MELVTQSEFARRTGKSKQVISQLVKLGKLPKKKGRLEFEKCEKILNSLSKQNGGGRPPKNKIPVFGDLEGDDNSEIVSIELALRKARLAKETFSAKIAELEYKEKDKKSIPIGDIADTISQVNGSIRERLLQVGKKLGRQLEGKTAIEITQGIEDEVNEILTELYSLSGESIDV